MFLILLMFLSLSGGGTSDVNEPQLEPPLITVSETHYAQSKEEIPTVMVIEIDSATTTLYELESQGNKISEQIEKVDGIDGNLEIILEQLKIEKE